MTGSTVFEMLLSRPDIIEPSPTASSTHQVRTAVA